MSRFYHSLNSKYNIYFNGKTTFDEALKSLNEGYKENYTEQIVMFPVSGVYKQEKTSAGGAFDRAIEKGNKAIKLHSIKDKPPRRPGWQSDPRQVRLQQQEEFNPFTKQCWLLVAQSHFYNGDFLNAAVTFSYITRHFSTDPALVAEARIWQARCYSELKWNYEVNNILKKLSESGVPAKLQKEYDRMYADYLIKNEQDSLALPYLQSAVKAEKNKRQRSRQRYLLGQLYMKTGNNDLAYSTFGKVAGSNPPYDIEFASRIRQTEVFPGNNYQKVLKMLRRMSKSDKNKDYLDQVFYAMGNVYMTQQDTAKAIEAYAEGIEKSTQNGMDKAICQIRLGDIYFEQKKYMEAQPCFSGALQGIHKEYKDYERVARLSETLDELVVHYEAVHLQDSLQTLSKMPEAERLAVIDKIIEDLKEAEKKAKEEAEKEEYLANQASMGSNLSNRPGAANTMNMPTAGAAAGSNAFYFYNPQTVAQGKTQFQNKWGKRSLEDNWRRRNKKMELLLEEGDENADRQGAESSLSAADSLATDSLTALNDSLASDPKSREYYLQQIPFSEDDLYASDKIIEDGLFNMGMIYKDKLEDIDLTVETFEELERRFPDNAYRLDYYYHTYLMALRFKDAELAERYKAKLLADFPESDYAVAISDPDYEYNMRMMGAVQDSIYEQTYEAYLAEDTAAVRLNYREFYSKYPLAELMPKFMFLNALTYVQSGDAERFKEELTLLTEKFPAADVSELAAEMLKGLLRGRKLMQTSFSKMTWNIRFGADEEGNVNAADSARAFTTEQETPHRMLLIYSTDSLDRNRLLFTIAAYNFANFRIKTFDLAFEQRGSLTLFFINGFNNFTEVIEYYKMIYGKGGYAEALDPLVSFFPISDANYDILVHGKTLEEYMLFFIDNYGEQAPELVERWRIRVDADRRALEEEEAAEAEAETAKAGDESSPTDSTQSLNPSIPQSSNPSIHQSIKTEPIEPPKVVITPPAAPAQSLNPSILQSTEEEDARPKAKGENIFRKLFKRIKETDEYKQIEEGIKTAKEVAAAVAEDDAPADSAAAAEAAAKPLERVDGELTLEQIQEIRRQENAEQVRQDSIANAAKVLSAKEAADLKKQQAAEREQLRKQREKDNKERLRLKEKERKQREKENKKRQAEERKKKKQEQQAKEKARKAAAAQKEAERKAAAAKKEAEQKAAAKAKKQKT
ncbi:MAG: hypothetical protein LBR18_04820 [Tannerella sp.]|nr:hypothetical protein [Tannerella sp.]